MPERVQCEQCGRFVSKAQWWAPICDECFENFMAPIRRYDEDVALRLDYIERLFVPNRFKIGRNRFVQERIDALTERVVTYLG